MHIKLSTKSCNGNRLKTCFKVDTGADGNLLPLGEFFKHFPDANMTQLAKIIDPHTKLYVYNITFLIFLFGHNKSGSSFVLENVLK